MELAAAAIGLGVGLALAIIIHELGHFLVAKFLGMTVLFLSIGKGRLIYSGRFANTPAEFRLWPIRGHVLFVIPEAAGRGQLGLTYAAGILANLLAGTLAWLVFSLPEMSAPFYAFMLLVMGYQFIVAALNLIPRNLPNRQPPTPNDSKVLLGLLLGRDINALLFSGLARHVVHPYLPAGDKGYVPSPALLGFIRRGGLRKLVMAKGIAGPLISQIQDMVQAGQINSEERCALVDSLITRALLGGQFDEPGLRDLLEAALALAPQNIALQHSLGALLVELGDIEAAQPLLAAGSGESRGFDQAVTQIYQVRSLNQSGKRDEARELAAAAEGLARQLPQAFQLESLLKRMHDEIGA